MRNLFFLLASTAALLCAQAVAPRQSSILDRENTGEAQQWYSNPQKITSQIAVPGSWQAQGFGEPLGVLRHHYEGVAWYAKQVTVPPEWRGKKIYLSVGGAFTYTKAYVMPAGSHEGFSTPFRLNLTLLGGGAPVFEESLEPLYSAMSGGV